MLCVHVLRTHDHDVAELFGAESGDDVDQFERIAWTAGPRGVPVIDRCDWFAGSIVDRVDNGRDHDGFVLEPFSGVDEARSSPILGYQRARDIDADRDA